MKICNTCFIKKPLDEFGKNSAIKDGHSGKCKECEKKYRKAYLESDKGKEMLLRTREKNKESIKLRIKAYMRTEKGKELKRKARKKYKNTERGKDKQREYLRKAVRKKIDDGYYRFGKGAISLIRNGAMRRGVEFSLTAEELEHWWKNKEDVCEYCGTSISEYIQLRDFILDYDKNNYEIRKFKKVFSSEKQAKIRWMTIDRINNGKGYEIHNIAKCCWFCNHIKGVYISADDMKIIGKRIMDRLKREISLEQKQEDEVNQY